MLAVLRAGAVLVPMNTAYTPEDVAYVVRDAEPAVMVDDAHLAELLDAAAGLADQFDDPEVGPLSLPGIVPRFSRTPAALAWAGPRMGEHNGEVYGGLLGLAPSEVDDLRARGVI